MICRLVALCALMETNRYTFSTGAECAVFLYVSTWCGVFVIDSPSKLSCSALMGIWLHLILWWVDRESLVFRFFITGRLHVTLE